MGSNGPGNPVLVVLFACIAGSLLLAIIGFVLHGRGKLTNSRAALAWAILTILPLFGAGFVYMTKHQVEQATGVTKSGVNEPGVQGAP